VSASQHRDPAASSRSTRAMRVAADIGLVAVVTSAALADYLSSWLPKVGGFPAGAIIRDALALSFILLAAITLMKDRTEQGRPIWRPSPSAGAAEWIVLPLALLAVWVFVLVAVSAETVPSLLAARNLLLYVTVGLAAFVLLVHRRLDPAVLVGTLTVFGFAAGTLGILDTATHGEIVSNLGYSRDYSGVEGSSSILIAGASASFQGYVRASGGISNALVFGYLMAAIAVFATWMLERSVAPAWKNRRAVIYIALGIVAGVACIESLTRGAMGALVVGLLLLVVVRRTWPVVIGAISTVAIALVLTVAGSGFAGPQTTPNGQPGNGPGLIEIVGDRVTSSDESSQASSSLRLDQVRKGVDSLVARPLGNGLGSEGSASTRGDQQGSNLTPDVFVLIVALQTGIVGAGLYAAIVVALLIWALRDRRRGQALVLALIAVFAVTSVLSASPDAPVFATIFWILVLAVSAVPMIDQVSAETAMDARKDAGPQVDSRGVRSPSAVTEGRRRGVV
jgi:hypothetical protein